MHDKMRILTAVMCVFCASAPAIGGDDASGPTSYTVDLSAPFTTYHMTAGDKRWSESLVRNLKYSGRVLHFVRTSLFLTRNNEVLQGAVYQSLESPDLFYIVPGDLVLRIGAKWPISQGSGGFSAHAPPSRNFIVALYCCVGVPVMSSTPVVKGKISWKGTAHNRFE